jgi:hypothetical protein
LLVVRCKANTADFLRHFIIILMGITTAVYILIQIPPF